VNDALDLMERRDKVILDVRVPEEHLEQLVEMSRDRFGRSIVLKT